LLYCLVKTNFLKSWNNSITDPTIQALAGQVWHDHSELVRVLAEVDQYTGFTPVHISGGIPQIEDIVARTNHVFGPVLHTTP
jgi:hypothetical protein